MTVYEVDFVCKEDMLEVVDKLRQSIADGEIVSFAAVGLQPGGVVMHWHSAFGAQKPALIGAMLMKANVLSAEYSADAMNEALNS